jgi:hypothetical protein
MQRCCTNDWVKTRHETKEFMVEHWNDSTWFLNGPFLLINLFDSMLLLYYFKSRQTSRMPHHYKKMNEQDVDHTFG